MNKAVPESEDRSLNRSTAFTLIIATLIVCVLIAALTYVFAQDASIALVTLSLWACIVYLVWNGLPHHPHRHFGPANTVTTLRAVATVLLAGLIPIAEQFSTPDMNHWLWALTGAAVLTLSLDGLDGYLARKTALSSSMGARFDMETDSLLALVIAIFLWQSGEVGLWILGLGVLRYAFVFASIWLTPLKGRLYPSLRRKTVCVVQLAALCALLSPVVQPPLSVFIGLIALVCLIASFARDILWLYTRTDQ